MGMQTMGSDSVDPQDAYEALNVMVRRRRARLAVHPMYHAIADRVAMRTFMESHVFAVWDFMSLLKALQQGLTCVKTPWVPTGNADTRAFINEIVAAEESDDGGDGRHLSHLEIYMEAMDESGANTQPIRRFLDLIRNGRPVGEALVESGAPKAAERFTTATMVTVESGDLVQISASFCLAREAIIPTMFRPLIRRVDTADGVKSPRLRYYFDRHVELDGGSHGDLAKRMVLDLCGDDSEKWRRASDAAANALDHRQQLWDAIEEAVCQDLSDDRRQAVKNARRDYETNQQGAAFTEEAAKRQDSFAARIIYIVSFVVCAAVAFLILGPRPDGVAGTLDVSFLPTVNASLNGAVTVLLLLALWFIKQGDVERHKKVMLAAFGLSAAFLVTYIIYHFFKAGPKPYVGPYRGLYLCILLSHIVLAVSVLPLALFALHRGWHMQVAKHRRIVRYAYPIWLYVSLTGVLIYVMLY
jgi:uncharacterized membrane protein YozB (DUF420 family)